MGLSHRDHIKPLQFPSLLRKLDVWMKRLPQMRRILTLGRLLTSCDILGRKQGCLGWTQTHCAAQPPGKFSPKSRAKLQLRQSSEGLPSTPASCLVPCIESPWIKGVFLKRGTSQLSKSSLCAAGRTCPGHHQPSVLGEEAPIWQPRF